ncbi:MAG: translation elongation factor 4 [Candidatus Eiseniibacteriota bacterium]|jgi:GTP-binding protein LepA
MSRETRNFCIIAHIDHGKSTLADRLLERTHALPSRRMMNQVLDDMELERERGITIKSHPITFPYRSRAGTEVTLNLIDTPGHVDFSYEVSRSLSACEGAVLVVDAAQGIEAQTLSNLYQALEQDLTIIPVINKIDLPAARTDEVAEEVGSLLGEDPGSVLKVSAKVGTGVDALLEALVAIIPPPRSDVATPLRAMIFDSEFNSFRGVVATVRVIDGTIRPGMRVRMMSTGSGGPVYEVDEVGIFRLDLVPREALEAGDVGYVIAGIKNLHDVRVGDTITDASRPAETALPGYRPLKPMVFSGLYPIATEDYEDLKAALDKLALNDASFFFEPETSAALGFGFRCGFLGLLHLEIVRERLEREYGLGLISTTPAVSYRVNLADGRQIMVDNPAKMPPAVEIETIEEPFVRTTLVTPSDYLGALMKLCQDRRGEFRGVEYPLPGRAIMTYDVPLAEIVLDFYDRLKSLTRGYASLDYEPIGYRVSKMVKLDILLNGDPVDALSAIVHTDKAYDWGRSICGKLKTLIPRQLFQVAIQAAVGSRVIARETVSARRKDVTAKCYGGDITRKRKLLERQKEGKKRMKQIGSVEVPQEAFLAVLKVD